MIAATTGKREMIELLLRSGADPAASDDCRRNALHWATSRGDVPEAVALLVRSGIDVNASDVGGFTPLIRAAEMGHPKTVAALLKLGADPKANWKVKRRIK